jgi:hypothetical protein
MSNMDQNTSTGIRLYMNSMSVAVHSHLNRLIMLYSVQIMQTGAGGYTLAKRGVSSLNSVFTNPQFGSFMQLMGIS